MSWRRYRGPVRHHVLSLVDDDDDDAEQLDIALIDGVFTAFFQQHDVDSLLDEVGDFVGGVSVRYTFDNLTWCGTLDDFRTRLGRGRFHHQLIVRLSSDGFRYPALSRNAIKGYTHGTSRGWLALTSEFILAKLPAVAALAERLQTRVRVLYNLCAQRVDIQFVEDGDVRLLVAFEGGRPIAIPRDEYFAHFGLKARSFVTS
jgi:hypothetical protein